MGKTFKHGFTLIEILLVVSIIAILSAMVIPNVGKYADINTLDQTVQNVGTNVDLVKFKALSGAYSNTEPASWGVTFCPDGDTTKYKMYAITLPNGSNPGGVEQDVREILVENGVSFSCSANNTQVLFGRLTSRPIDATSKSVDLVKGNYIRRLTVDGNTGKVEIERIQ